jgi:putative transposase
LASKGIPHAQIPAHRIANRRHPQGAQDRRQSRNDLSQARHLGSNAVQLRAKYGGLEVSDLRRLRELEDENRRLKKIVADQALNIEALKVVAEGNF